MRLFEGTPFDRPPRCERCEQLLEECTCPPESPPAVPPGKQTARLTVERRKKGKVVTVVRGLEDADETLAALLGKLKSVCGAGGTLKDGELEIQGTHLDRIRELLISLGYRVHG